jgi:flagellar hook protein FlgE
MSFYTSLSGLKNAQTELNVVAHNIANAETVGFKKSRVQFSDIVASSAFTSPTMIQGIGSSVQAINKNYAMGPIEQTGGALDIAIAGDGFFTTKSAATGDTFYTRNGSFSVDEDGFVKDGTGNRLQIFAVGADPATDPTINAELPEQNAGGAAFAGVTIGADGAVKISYADGSNETIGSVALAQFTAPDGLRQVGASNWQASGVSGTAKYGIAGEGVYGKLMSGSIERSNVDIAEELVGLITAQRYFQANAKAIDTATQLSQTVLNLRS